MSPKNAAAIAAGLHLRLAQETLDLDNKTAWKSILRTLYAQGYDAWLRQVVWEERQRLRGVDKPRDERP